MKMIVKNLVNDVFDNAVEIRRHLHSFPEISGQEFLTAKFVKEQLLHFGVVNISDVTETGFVAEIFGKNPEKKVVAIRADMDALPILENNNVSYKSQNEGVMHACGHDVHTANLVLCAFIFNQLKEQFEGTVQLVFQPSEEKIPSGAARMLEAGVFNNRFPDAMIALHVDPSIPVGKIGYRCGMMSASADECYITVKGKGGHGAYPSQFINPIMMASQMMLDFQDIQHSSIPTVITFGKIEALGKTNVVPEFAKMEGTIRTFDETWRSEIHKQMINKAESIAETYGGEVDVNILVGYPVLKTDTAFTLRCKAYLEDFFGADCMIETPMRMGADDFSYFSQKIPSTMLRLGTRNEEKGIISPLHTNSFNVDEEAMKYGIASLCWITLKELNQ